ncbi:hypothetical protein [Natronococcus jeotgali]|uniref:Uncharacterized protein n=1 Tax=Natronococcus jeotgali DSM 18795 TaxID=1227498 RepID=L9Y0Z4_9EURY|nr:hypothetical protein [Natronococcus jeotgali]ELY66508.1 hypothetical protein C492_01249 [Natronococcus jeotgali DSM 18795]
MDSRSDPGATLLLVVSLLAVALVYGVLVPGDVLGDGSRTVLYVVVGWVPFTLVFYALGRGFSSPDALPSMRSADAGLALVLVSLLVSLGLETLGLSPEQLPEAYVLQAIGIFVGLALFGWGIGRRSRAIGQRPDP